MQFKVLAITAFVAATSTAQPTSILSGTAQLFSVGGCSIGEGTPFSFFTTNNDAPLFCAPIPANIESIFVDTITPGCTGMFCHFPQTFSSRKGIW
jgi:hypothetical protein